jgi:hypothetical protein
MRTRDRIRNLPRTVLLGLVIFACSAQIIHHDENAAAQGAQDFSRLAFVQRDYDAAYKLASSELRGSLTGQTFEATVQGMHPNTSPLLVDAREFEPIPGQRAMYIYIEGTNAGETFHYRLLMLGDASAGYSIGGFWRSVDAYPPSPRRSL